MSTNGSVVRHFVLSDYDDADNRVLKVTVVSDVAFLAFGTIDDAGNCTFDDKGSLGVDAESLFRMLGESMRSWDLHDYGRLRDGSLPADAPSLMVEQVQSPAPAIRRRVR